MDGNGISMSIMLKEIYQQPQAIAKAVEAEAANVAELVADMRKRDIRHVIIAARGTSDNAATYAKYLFEIVNGVPVGLAAPSVYTLYDAEIKLDDSLVIGISQSGQAPDVVQTLTRARAAGALTACVTNVPGSPIVNACQYALQCHAGEEQAVAATKTYTTSLALMALLAGTWADSALLLDGLKAMPEQIDKTLQLDETIEASCERYRYIQECAVLARGLNQCTALEAALKLTETCYLVAKPYSGADFLHGPIAMISEGFPCILFAPSGKAYSSMLELGGKLRERCAELVVVSGGAEALALAAKPLAVTVPVAEQLSPLVYIVPAQLFAYHLARYRGHDPDKPRGLSKVTLTR